MLIMLEGIKECLSWPCRCLGFRRMHDMSFLKLRYFLFGGCTRAQVTMCIQGAGSHDQSMSSPSYPQRLAQSLKLIRYSKIFGKRKKAKTIRSFYSYRPTHHLGKKSSSAETSRMGTVGGIVQSPSLMFTSTMQVFKKYNFL